MALAEMDGCGDWGFGGAFGGGILYVRCGFGEGEVVKVPGYQDCPAGGGVVDWDLRSRGGGW